LVSGPRSRRTALGTNAVFDVPQNKPKDRTEVVLRAGSSGSARSQQRSPLRGPSVSEEQAPQGPGLRTFAFGRARRAGVSFRFLTFLVEVGRRHPSSLLGVGAVCGLRVSALRLLVQGRRHAGSLRPRNGATFVEMARDLGRRADPDRPDSAEGSPSAVDERFLRAASAAALLRRWLEGGAPRLRSGATRGPAVNSKQDRSWLRLDLCCGRVARACRQRANHLDP